MEDEKFLTIFDKKPIFVLVPIAFATTVIAVLVPLIKAQANNIDYDNVNNDVMGSPCNEPGFHKFWVECHWPPFLY